MLWIYIKDICKIIKNGIQIGNMINDYNNKGTSIRYIQKHICYI